MSSHPTDRGEQMARRDPALRTRAGLAAAAAAAGVLGAAGCSTAAASATSPRKTLELGRGWRFLRAASRSAERPDFDDSGWREVDLPHTWNAVDGQDGPEPTLRIASRRFRERRSASAQIAVITNLRGVELRVNGALLPPPAADPTSRILRWRAAPLALGDNEVTATAVAPDGSRLSDRVRWRRVE